MKKQNPSPQVTALIQQFEAECDQLKESATTVEQNFKLLQELEASLTQRAAQKAAEIKKLQLHCSEIQSEIQAQSATQASLKGQIDATEGLLEELIEELPTFQSQVQKKLEQTQRLRDRLAGKELEFKSQRNHLHKNSEALLKKEKALQNYKALLNKHASHIREMAESFSKLLEESQTLLPLIDYHTLTEFELVQAEKQLGKTPESSPDRSKLEAGVIQLTNQKNFLLASVQETQRALQNQIESLRPLSLDLELPSHPEDRGKAPQA